MASPKREKVPKRLFEETFISSVLNAQDYLPDKLGCILILVYALRRAELAGVRFRDFDFERRQLTVLGKGSQPRLVPIVDEPFWRDLGAVDLELQPRKDWFLVCPHRTVGMKTYHFHHRGFQPRSVHTWWYDRLQAAGFCGDRESGTRIGLNMHRGRHTVATDILRQTGNIVAASKLLGHAQISTTEESYAEFDVADLAAVLRSMRLDEEG